MNSGLISQFLGMAPFILSNLLLKLLHSQTQGFEHTNNTTIFPTRANMNFDGSLTTPTDSRRR